MSHAGTLISKLKLAPHPEGGHYRQTWVAPSEHGQRPVGTCIHFLLKAGESSR